MIGKVRNAYETHFLGSELMAALLVSGAFMYVHYATRFGTSIDTVLQGNRAAIYATLASVFGALLGFVITALSIVLGYASDPRLKKLRESRHYSTLWHIFISSTRWLAVVTVITVAALIFDREARPRSVLLYATVATSTVAVARVARVLWAVEHLVWILVRRTEIAEASARER